MAYLWLAYPVAYRCGGGGAVPVRSGLQPQPLRAGPNPLSSRDFDLSVLASCGPAGWPGAYKRPARGCLCRRLLPLVGQQPLNEAVRLGGLRGRRQEGLLVAPEDRDPVGQIIGVVL